MSLTLESLDTRLKAVEAKLGIGTPYKLKLGFVATDMEVGLVKQIGCNLARIQGWPGSAQQFVANGAFSHGVEVSIRIAREYIKNTTSKALEPLTTDALRREMTLKVSADLAIYGAHGATSYIFGNEPDGSRDGQPRYWTGKIDRFGTDWAQYITPLARKPGNRVGFGLPIFPSATAKFAANLVSSGAYQPGDFFAANVYGGNAEQHHAIKDQHIAALREAVPTFNPDTDFEISEAGLKRGGGQDAWVADFARAIQMYRDQKFPGVVSIYRIDENSEAPFAPFKDGIKTATFDRWRQIAA